MTPEVSVRRVYENPEPQQGTRVLVDRLWPRGLRKDAARLDEWARDVAPSSQLRTWYGHDPAKFPEFRRRYLAELTQPGPQAALSRLRALAAEGPVILLTATRDASHSEATVLAELLRAGDSERDGGGDPVCWAHLVCPDCGAVTSEGHRPGCGSGQAGS
jgi:uncharacterized protein YeaO (DUF488 family)